MCFNSGDNDVCKYATSEWFYAAVKPTKLRLIQKCIINIKN